MERILVVVLIVAAFSTQGAAAPSSGQKPGFVPGDLFYPVEQAVESLEVRIAGIIGGPELKAKALANNADERVAEARKLTDKNRSKRAERMAEDYNRTMEKSREAASRSSDQALKDDIENMSSRNEEVLKGLKDRVPPQAQKGIENAIENSEDDPGSSERTPDFPEKDNRNDGGDETAVPPELPEPEPPVEGPDIGNVTEQVRNLTENETDETNSSGFDNSTENITGQEAEENVTEGLTGNAVQKELPEKRPENLDEEKNQEVGSGRVKSPF